MAAVVCFSVSLFVAFFAVAPAAAQSENPYGSTSTTAPPQQTASCSIDQTSGIRGGTISGTLFDVEAGSSADFYLDSVLLGTIEAPAAPQTFSASPIGATVDAAFSFTIPADLPAGAYTPTIVGATFNSQCALPGDAEAFEVLAASVGQQGEDESEVGDVLPFTGFETTFLVSLGLLLIAIGYAVVRRRRGYVN